MSARVPEPHLSAWRALLNAPGRHVRMAELADGLTLSRGGVTKLVDRLESAGLLRRERAEDDGRGFYAALTDAGEEMLRRVWPVYARILREAFVDTLTEEEAAVISAGLARVKEAAAFPAQPT